MPIVFSLQVAGDQTDKGDQTNQGDKTDWDDHGDQTHHSHSIEYEVVRQPSNMRNCQYPVSMSESMTIISRARDAGTPEKPRWSVEIVSSIWIVC